MARKKTHRKGKKYVPLFRRKSTKVAAEKAAVAALAASQKGKKYLKKKVTKENIRKAAAAAKAASQKLYGLLHKKKVPQRITMSIFRE